MKYCFTLLLCCLLTGAASAQTGIAVPAMHAADSLIKAFMTNWGIDGGAAAITKDGRLIYNRGFGYADQDSGEVAKPYNLYRIASVSKPITAIAIMKLIQNGQLSLTDTVFGPGRILDQPYYLNAITDNQIYNITVRQLLEHTAGWDRDIPCDGYGGCDPIGFPLHVTNVLGEPDPVGDSTLIKFLLQKGLNHVPGTVYAYSNIGYLVLGKIIEKKTGMKYGQYVQSAILNGLNLCDIHLGKNRLADKQEREGEYNSPYTTQSCYGDGTTVPWQYGGWNLEAMNAHGGWIATAADLTRLILAVDGFNTVPDILNPATIQLMVTPSTVNSNYAKGWSVNPANNWWHTGSLDGTSSFICRSAGGYTWAFLFNKRSDANTFWTDLDQLPWNCLAATTAFPTHNLFAPATQASGLQAAPSGNTAALQWTNGSGDRRLVVASEDTAWYDFPDDGLSYTANAAFGQGQALGNHTYVVYDGTGSNVTVTGLNTAKSYRFTVYEYYRNSTTGNNPVYKYGCRSEAAVPATTSISVIGGNKDLAVFPNPAGSEVSIICNKPQLDHTRCTITDMSGRTVRRFELRSGRQTLSLQQLVPGVYTLHLKDGSTVKLVRY